VRIRPSLTSAADKHDRFYPVDLYSSCRHTCQAMALGQHTLAAFADHLTFAKANHWTNHDAIGCHGRQSAC
jgi:hypothetical protein